MSTLLTIDQLKVELQQKTILVDVNLRLNSGNILGLVGPSGCGKTTLLNTIAGFINQCAGDITLNGEPAIHPKQLTPPEQRNIGMIFQDYALFPHLTVNENIAFGIQNINPQDRTERINELLTLLKLNEFSARYPHQLSGGQQQRVAIARALAPRPKLLLLDEPFSNIDARLRNELMLELRALLKKLNMTAIFVTHNKDEVFTFADQIAVMHQGQVLQSGKIHDVFQSPCNWQVADFLQMGSWLPLHVSNNKVTTAIGDFEDTAAISKVSKALVLEKSCYLLLKPKNIVINTSLNANAKVESVSITEQGFHYLLTSITEKPEHKFEQLSFYSENSYQPGQLLSIDIIAHDYQIFTP